jgi:hypothetical protein
MIESTLHTDTQGRTWHVLERDGGSISVYYTREAAVAHFVVWDSLDAGKARQTVAWDIVRAAGQLVCSNAWADIEGEEAEGLEQAMQRAGLVSSMKAPES